jgi:autotransporter-associated beta strand protein
LCLHFSTGSGGIVTGHGNLNLSSNMTGAANAFGLVVNGGGNSSMNGISTGALINFNKQGLGIWTVNGNLNLVGGEIRPQGGIVSFSATSSTTANAPIAGRSNQGVIRFATGSSVLTATANTNGILGGWATFDNSTWAKTNGSGNAIDGFTAFTDDTWAAGTNTNVTLAGGNPSADSTTNSVRFNEAGAKTLTLAGINTLTSGGILVTGNVGANTTTIAGGTLTTTGANNDLILNQFNSAANLTVSTVLSNNVRAARTGTTTSGSNSITGLTSTADLAVGMLITGTGMPANATITAINSATQITISGNATATGTPSLSPVGVTLVTKTGTGTVVLSGANNYTGTTRVFEGTLRVTGNNGNKYYEVGSQGRLELDIDGGTSGYGRGILVNGGGVDSTNGAYLAGGRNFNFQSTLRLAGAPTTVRQFGTGAAILHGWDTNGTHLAVENTASGSVIGTNVNFQSGGFGYVMNIAPGLNTATGDVIINGILSGSTVYRKTGFGSVRLDGSGSSNNTGSFDLQQGSLILAGSNNRLGSGSNVILGNGANSSLLVLEGVNQTLTALTTAGTGTDNRVVGGSATLSTLTLNNPSDINLTATLGGPGTFQNNLAFVKGGAGKLTLTATNTYSGTTNLNAGILELSYAPNNTSKLADSSTLTLNGGTVSLSGGSHEEIVGSTVVTANSSISRASGAAVIQLGELSRTGAATLTIAGELIAKTSTPNQGNGRLPSWITVNGSPAANDGNGNIVLFSGFADVFRLGGVVPNNAEAVVRIVEGGTSGPVTLATAGLNEIASLQQNASGGPAVVDLGGGNILRLGETGSIATNPGAGALTITNGELTAGNGADSSGQIVFSAEADITLEAPLKDNGSGSLEIVKTGPGALTLDGANDHTGGTTLNAGSLLISNELALGFNGTLTFNGGAFDNISGAPMTVGDAIPQVWGGNFTFTGSDDLVFSSGAVTVTGNRIVTVPENTLEIRGAVGGTNGFTKNGDGRLLLTSGSSNWTGTTTVNAGVLEVPARTGDTPYVIAAPATLLLGYNSGGGYANSNIKINGAGVSATTGLYLIGGASFNASGGIELLTAPTTIRHTGTGLASIGTFDINGNGIVGSVASSGSIIDGNIQMISRGFGMSVNIPAGADTATGDLLINGQLNVGNLGFIKRGAGSVVLGSPGTTGNVAVRIEGGSIITAALGALGVNADLLISSGAGLVLSGNSQAARNLTGAGSVINGSTTAAVLTISQTTATTFSGVLGGASADAKRFSLVKSGASSLTLTGANSYTGSTTVSSGALALTQAYLEDTADVILGDTATLQLDTGATDTILSLVVNGDAQPAGVYGPIGSGAQFERAYLTGTGRLQVTVGPSSNPYDEWSLQIADETKRGRGDDPDGDGFTNIQEFLFGTSPIESTGSLSTATTSGSILTIRWKQRVAGATYSLEESSTLADPWIISGATPTDDGAAVGDYQPRKADVTIGSGKNFFRVEGTEN